MKQILIGLLLGVGVAFGDEIAKTNLQATVTSQIVTNVVAGDNQRGCSICEMLRKSAAEGIMLALHHPYHAAEPWRAANEKWEITNVSSNVTVKVEWNGKVLSHSDETLLRSVTNRWKLAQEWKKE